MTAFPVVEHLDVFEHVGFGRLPGGIPGTMHPLVLQAVEEALGGRVIPAVALAAHGTDHARMVKKFKRPVIDSMDIFTWPVHIATG